MDMDEQGYEIEPASEECEDVVRRVLDGPSAGLSCFRKRESVPAETAVSVPVPERNPLGMREWEEEICELYRMGNGVESVASKCGVTVGQVRRVLESYSERYAAMTDMEAYRRKVTGLISFHRINKRVTDELSGMLERRELKPSELITLKKHLDEVNPDKLFVKTTRQESVSARVVFTVGDASARARELGLCQAVGGS